MKYRIKINIGDGIETKNKEEALQKFYGKAMYPNTDLKHFLDKNTTIERIK